MSELNRAASLTDELENEIDDIFAYHPWTIEQREAGEAVRKALADAFKVIVDYVPPSADRAVALRKLREARMDANSAITHKGRY